MSERKGSSNGWRDWDNAVRCGVGRRERRIRTHASFQLFKPPRHYFNSAKSAWRFLSGSRANPPATTPPLRISGSTESGQLLAHDPVFPIRAALPRRQSGPCGPAIWPLRALPPTSGFGALQNAEHHGLEHIRCRKSACPVRRAGCENGAWTE